MAVRIKSWTKFQHFKDRKPPWIKLYRDLLEDINWHKLDGETAKMLVMFWLIASEDDGQLPDVETLAFRLRKSDSEVESVISKLSHWLEHGDDSLISPRYQDDTGGDIKPIALARSRETEEETETETEGDTAAIASARQPRSKKAPKTELPEGFGISDRVKLWAASHGYDRLEEHFDAFIRKVKAKGYAYVSWDDAFMEAIREDWAKLRGRAANGAAPPPDIRTADPDSRSSVEAEGIAKGVGAWNESREQFPVYKARVRAASYPGGMQ